MSQQYPNQPYQNQPRPGGPPPGYGQAFPGGAPSGIPPKKPKTKLVVGAVGAAAVLIAAAIVVVAASKSDGDAKAGPQAGKSGGDGKPVAKIERPGYQDQAAVADPFAIVEEPNPTPSRYNGKPVTQACNLLSLKELADHGVHLASRTDPGYALNRNYLADEAVPDQANPPKPSDQILNETPDQNFCEYNVEYTAGGGATPEVFKTDVYQPPYYDISKVPELYLSGDYVKYAKQESIGQVELYTPIKPPVSKREVILRLGDTYVWVTALVSEQGGELGTRFDPLVNTVAANIAKQAANPTGPSRYRYDSPTFKTPAGLACDILLPADVKTLLGKPASPVTKNDPATAIGKISVPEDHTEGNFLHTACTRRAGDGLHDAGFELTVDTYDDTKLAAGVFRFHRGAGKGLPVPTPVGDESYVDSVGDALTQPGKLVVRKGNVIVALATSVNGLDLTKMVETADKYLRPVVEQMLTRLPK